MSNPAQRNPRTFVLVLLACLAVSLVCVVYPIYVIRPFRHQGADELAAALAITRFRPAITVISAIAAVLENGQLGEVYNIGTGEERTNLDVLDDVCEAIAARKNVSSGELKKRIRHVVDRPGHDRRYALDTSKIRGLGWESRVDLASGLEATVRWYLENRAWVEDVAGRFDRTQRMGLV